MNKPMISHHFSSSNPHFREMRAEKKTINISLTDHLVHFLIRELFLSRVIHSYIAQFVYTTWQILAHITEIHGILCDIWYCIGSYDIQLQSLALWGMVLAWAGSRGLEGLWIDMDLCCKSSPNSDQTTTNTYKQFQTLPYPIFHIQLTQDLSSKKNSREESLVTLVYSNQ